jgi:peptidoglycan/LPS O-acetylase OafA/YrhL
LKTIASSTRLPGLDTLRAFAVLVVMLYHLSIFGELPKSLLPVTAYGWMGVDLFFVLSGFLNGQQVLKPYRQGQRPPSRNSTAAAPTAFYSSCWRSTRLFPRGARPHSSGRFGSSPSSP